MPTYATADDLAAYPGGSAVPAGDVETLLARGHRFLGASLFRYCWYQGTDGMPSNPLVTAAFRDCVCAQVVWWATLGDSIGALGAGYGSVEIGSVRLSRTGRDGIVAPDGSDSPARQIAPEVGDVLTQPELTPDVLTVGLVIT